MWKAGSLQSTGKPTEHAYSTTFCVSNGVVYPLLKILITSCRQVKFVKQCVASFMLRFWAPHAVIDITTSTAIH
jgi:hypothetical protein